jgi:hypothetical protein
MGQQTAEVLQAAVASAANQSSGMLATLIGIVTLIATASGVFGEMQAALSSIWKAKPRDTTMSCLIRARVSGGMALKPKTDQHSSREQNSYRKPYRNPEKLGTNPKKPPTGRGLRLDRAQVYRY